MRIIDADRRYLHRKPVGSARFISAIISIPACTFGFGNERRQLLSESTATRSANVSFRLAFCRDALNLPSAAS